MAAEGAAGTAGSRAGTVAVTARVVWTAARAGTVAESWVATAARAGTVAVAARVCSCRASAPFLGCKHRHHCGKEALR